MLRVFSPIFAPAYRIEVAMAINYVKSNNKELYNKLNNLKDEQGQDVDVYVYVTFDDYTKNRGY